MNHVPFDFVLTPPVLSMTAIKVAACSFLQLSSIFGEFTCCFILQFSGFFFLFLLPFCSSFVIGLFLFFFFLSRGTGVMMFRRYRSPPNTISHSLPPPPPNPDRCSVQPFAIPFFPDTFCSSERKRFSCSWSHQGSLSFFFGTPLFPRPVFIGVYSSQLTDVSFQVTSRNVDRL